MGIPYFYGYLYKKYKIDIDRSSDQIFNQNINYLFFDYNSLIHPCAQKILNNLTDPNTNPQKIETDIINYTIEYTKYTISLFKSSLKKIYIGIDGVAPRGKLNQQRERRYKSYYMKCLENKLIWDTNQITPGTQFMKNLEIALLNFIKNYDIEIVLDSWTNQGEGEHKIMKEINQMTLQNEQIMIYGLDGDLIILSLLSKFNENIILLRNKEEHTEFNYLEIKTLKTLIQQEVPDTPFFLKDFIFMSFFLGNDFLHNIPTLNIKTNAIDILFKIYKQYNWRLVDDNNKIIFKHLKNFIGKFAEIEDYYYNKIHPRNKMHYNDNELYLQDNNLIKIYTYDLFEFEKNIPKAKQLYYNYYHITNLQKTTENYIQGLYWVWDYYNFHQHNNWDWYYKYHVTPFASDLIKYMKYNMTFNFLPNKAYSITTQLIYILPKDSLLSILHQLNDVTLANKIKRLIHNKSFNTIFPNKIFIDMINKQFLWQGKVLFENLDENLYDVLC